MFTNYKKNFIAIITAISLTSTIVACAPTQSNYEGAGAGAVIGGVAGALIDRSNPWRGAMIGGALGAVAGASMAEVSKRAANEARSNGRPVSYERQTDNGGWQRVEAAPRNRYQGDRCVLVKTFENGRVVDEQLTCD
jgi:outer membrane lipoprotein SlyB